MYCIVSQIFTSSWSEVGAAKTLGIPRAIPSEIDSVTRRHDTGQRYHIIPLQL